MPAYNFGKKKYPGNSMKEIELHHKKKWKYWSEGASKGQLVYQQPNPSGLLMS